jgi:pilus assembly protein FimV
VLRVTSPRPVTEPFVTLLVEANWPRGRLLREYTVLLDPPGFRARPAVGQRRSRRRGPAREFRWRDQYPSARSPSAAKRRSRNARPLGLHAPVARPASQHRGWHAYQVRPNDTLWRIASAAHPGSRSDVNRAMVSIYQNNPEAFDGNINVLRAGSTLRIPQADEVAAVSAAAAAAEVSRQYEAWRSGRAASASPSVADTGRLRLVTPEQGTTAPSTATTPRPLRRLRQPRSRPPRVVSTRASGSWKPNLPRRAGCSRCATLNSRPCKAATWRSSPARTPAQPPLHQ